MTSSTIIADIVPPDKWASVTVQLAHALLHRPAICCVDFGRDGPSIGAAPAGRLAVFEGGAA